MAEEREPELEEIDEYEGKESPGKRKMVNLILLLLVGGIVALMLMRL